MIDSRQTEKELEFVDRYIYAVLRHVKKTERPQVRAALRDRIAALLNEKCRDRDPTERDVAEILQALGAPAALAAEYRGERQYLIGPEHYDTYLFLLRLVIGAFVAAAAAGLALEFFIARLSGAQAEISDIFCPLMAAGLQGYLWVTLLFVITERLMKKFVHPDDWRLFPADPGAYVHRGDCVVPIVAMTAFVAAVCFADSLLGVFYLDGGRLVAVPFFSAGKLRRLLPLILALGSVTLVKECVKMLVGFWNITLSFFVVLLNLGTVFLCVMIFGDPELWNGSFVTQLRHAGHVVSAEGVGIWKWMTSNFVYFIVFYVAAECGIVLHKGLKYHA